MKKITNIVVAILLIIFGSSCENDDDNPSRASEFIEVIVDSGTPILYSSNIDVQLVPLVPVSGFQAFFYINSEKSNGDSFHFEFPKISQTTYSVPFQYTLGHPLKLSQLFTAFGLNIDDANPGNSMYVELLQFGVVASQVKIKIDSFYYDFNNTMHTISINIDVLRDQ